MTQQIKTVVNGPITFTPDANPLIGPAFALPNAWLLTGSRKSAIMVRISQVVPHRPRKIIV